jgi:drug/metabolite transporter (DMT)-like permease
MYWLILLQQFFASTTHIATRSLALQCDPMLIVLLRAVVATAVFIVALLVLRKPMPPLDRKDIPLILLLGLVNIPGSQVLFVWGLKYTIPPNAALAYAMTPAFVLVICAVLFGDKATWRKWLGVGIAFSGVVLAVLERGVTLEAQYLQGNILEVGAAFAWSLYTVLGRTVAVKYGTLLGTTIGMVSGLLWYVPAYVVWRGPQTIIEQMSHLSPFLWLQVAYLAIFATCASFFLWFYAMSKIEPGKVAVFMNLQPIITTVLTVMIWNALPTVWFFVGAVLVVVGVVLTQRT